MRCLDAVLSRNLRYALSLTPYGPFWSLAYRGSTSYMLLDMGPGLRAAVLIAWPGALASARGAPPCGLPA